MERNKFQKSNTAKSLPAGRQNKSKIPNSKE